ncbi:MAG: hypothetical protein IMY72_11845 [Bacteroidetes bacterium]|nr:hypothetical protein [Bacteroidota bacterium]
MMNKNRLKRIVKIQNITLENTKKGVTQQWVYDNLIYPQFFISQSTYYEYLRIPAKALLHKYDKNN